MNWCSESQTKHRDPLSLPPASSGPRRGEGAEKKVPKGGLRKKIVKRYRELTERRNIEITVKKKFYKWDDEMWIERMQKKKLIMKGGKSLSLASSFMRMRR